MAYQMDFFAGIESKVLAAIGTKVQYPAYVFVRDEETSTTGRLAFVDQNNVLKYIRGENKQYVVNVDALPTDGDVEVLYIYEGIVYVFDGENYNPMYKDHTEELKDLTDRVDALEDADVEISGKITDLETETATISEYISDLEDKIEALEEKCGSDCEYLYEKVKYEITDTPVGTLVDYFDKEIRIMCPVNTEFTKQNVGTGGDVNSNYMTLKTYAPVDAVGYIEHLGNAVDKEILNDLTVDKYGRKYQPTWLALAKYDEATGVWTYNGANSTVKKYIGWDYQIDWYNADGIMIASDSVRINLSNEECHYAIEPFYIGKLTAEVDALKEANAEIVEQLKTVTEQMTDFEERIIEIEKESFTFIELE